MSRMLLTIKNGWIALVFQVFYIIIQFYSRNIFLDNLGDEFMGIIETLKSILQLLNLSELGIGTAVGFALYKPIYDDNKDKINEIIGYLGFLYKRIGFFVVTSAFVVMLFFPLFFETVTINLGVVLFAFTALLISNLLSYFFAYHMFLLEADQKGYLNITISQSVFILRLILQCIVLLLFKSFLLWIILELITPFLYIILLRKRIKKTYPWLIINYKATKVIREKNKALLQKIKQLSFHKLGTFVSNGTDNIIIFAFINPAAVAFVSNYQLVMNNINTLVSKLFDGTNASVGNLVAENDLKNMLKVFWEFMALRFFFAGCGSILLYIGFDDLITIWLGEKYLLSHNILIALIIIFFILQVRQPVDSFKQAYGLYDDIWAPVIQSLINLIFSIIFVIKYGIIGVFFGTIIGQIVIALVWRPYYLYNFGFKMKSIIYWKGFLLHLVYFGTACYIYVIIGNYLGGQKNTDILSLLFNLLKHGVLFCCLYFLILILLSKGFKNVLIRLLVLIKFK